MVEKVTISLIVLGLAISFGVNEATDIPDVPEVLLGPEKFFVEDFLLQVKNGISVHVYEYGNITDTLQRYVLNQSASSITKVVTDKDNILITLDWKDQVFYSDEDALKGVAITFTVRRVQFDGFAFGRRAGQFNFVMKKVVVDFMGLEGGETNVTDFELKMRIRSRPFDSFIVGPVGQAYNCGYIDTVPPGLFQKTFEGKHHVRLSFHDITVQAFHLEKPEFGPYQDCNYNDPTFDRIAWGVICAYFIVLTLCIAYCRNCRHRVKAYRKSYEMLD